MCGGREFVSAGVGEGVLTFLLYYCLSGGYRFVESVVAYADDSDLRDLLWLMRTILTCGTPDGIVGT